MWICLNDAFLSVVADKDNPERLLVRARRKSDLTSALGEDVEVIENAASDYRWRTFVDRSAVKELLERRIDTLSYTNFKNSVKSHDLHDTYMEFWHTHRRYQESDRREGAGARRGRSS